MRKLIPLTLSLAAFGFSVCALQAQTSPNLPPPQKRTSPHESIYIRLSDRNSLVSITYGRPYSKDPKTGAPRKIWGGLVKYNAAERLGSDEATLLLTQVPLAIGDSTIQPGAYTLYIVATESGAKIAFSSNIGKWGIPVDETHDVGRFDLKKEPLTPQVDQLTLALEKDPATPNGGLLKIMWETTTYTLAFAQKK